MQTFTVACIQCTSGEDQSRNLTHIAPLIDHACARGAEFISLPEGCNILTQGSNRERFVEEDVDPFVQGLGDIARTKQVWIHLGSALLQSGTQLVNRSLVFDASGTIVARYDKMHLFRIQHKHVHQDESQLFSPGTTPCCTTTPWGQLGLSICYDLRYPLLYRHLCALGADLLAVPAAFTQVTGKAHWKSLLRARAIENACFVIAAAQSGHHQDGRHTYGHSMIIDPWGTVLADAGASTPAVIVATLEAKQLDRARASLQAWSEDFP